MYSTSIAEWMIALFTSKKRAAAIVGDLLELRPQKGTLWFWLSLTEVTAAHGWRPVLAFIAAFYAGGWTFTGFQMAIFGIYAEHHPGYLWGLLLSVAGGVGTILWITGVYSTIRYGFRDRLTQLSLGLVSVMSVIIFYWWQPVILAACATIGGCLVCVSIMKQDRRKAALILLSTIGMGFVAFFLSMYFASLYQHFIYAAPVGQNVRQHLSGLWIGFCLYLLIACAIAMTCSFMHHRLLHATVLDDSSSG